MSDTAYFGLGVLSGALGLLVILAVTMRVISDPQNVSWSWFNVSAPMWIVGWFRGHQVTLRLWNLFNRVSSEGHSWGVGLLQVGRRHLFYIGKRGFIGRVRVLCGFIGRTE